MANKIHEKKIVLRSFKNGNYLIKQVPYICLDKEKDLYYLTPSVIRDLALLTEEMEKTSTHISEYQYS